MRMPRSPHRLALSPVCWGVSDVLGWGHQLDPERVLSEAAAVLHLEGTIDDMMNMMHAHPTVWEGMGDAFASVRGLQINV